MTLRNPGTIAALDNRNSVLLANDQVDELKEKFLKRFIFFCSFSITTVSLANFKQLIKF
ncbi:hypothetical protein BpHYR1_036878 [Brachionus plicatilis]|uniref:Uncharacterized protein n=1 Tax=Brachionus plicatilis TaxID=10195 RepID=A0A3M7QSL9_BRAPC|nr:hypothetical protein BpHYR1_036878 [Brachionus plicatilis]